MKTYRINAQIGNVKHSVSYHDGVKCHPDGSKFWDIQTFKNKKKLDAHVKYLKQNGYVII